KRVEARPPKGVGRNVYGFGALEVTGYEFEGRVMSSVFDGDDAYVFDYDKPDNPWFIRQVRDEVRRVSRGLYLGRMNVRRGGGYDFVTYFGLRRS
ncbi:MAG: hypothetical protein SV760_09940, partial [Halobacteria archaeon]|nr:hypothetical protein [Halobacteria archaeon]